MMIVYHGATCIVKQPLCLVGRPNLDFGQGFYVTDLREQAVNWAKRAANTGKAQWLNSYNLDIDKIRANYRCLHFSAYDKDWLDFIVACRNGNMPWQGYDFIEGGIADDRVVDTVNLYMLDMIPAEMAIQRLAQHRPNNQICLLSQQLINECLNFINAEPLNDLSAGQKGGLYESE